MLKFAPFSCVFAHTQMYLVSVHLLLRGLDGTYSILFSVPSTLKLLMLGTLRQTRHPDRPRFAANFEMVSSLVDTSVVVGEVPEGNVIAEAETLLEGG
ncbi:hypothetical protein MASR2M48_24790 [Spirochaetota bacterium]